MDFKVPFTKLTDLIAWSVLSLGVASVLWMPAALCVGKRPIVLLTLLIFVAGSIWSFRAKTFNSLLGARVLASIGMTQR
jgi:predicted MFS family arabinose efflux permease